MLEAIQIASGLAMQTISDRLYSCQILKQRGLHEVLDIGTLIELFIQVIIAIVTGSSSRTE